MTKDKFRRMNEGQWEPAFSGVMQREEALPTAVAAGKRPWGFSERTADRWGSFPWSRSDSNVGKKHCVLIYEHFFLLSSFLPLGPLLLFLSLPFPLSLTYPPGPTKSASVIFSNPDLMAFLLNIHIFWMLIELTVPHRGLGRILKKNKAELFILKGFPLKNLPSFPTPSALPLPLTHRPFCLPLALGLSSDAWLGHRRQEVVGWRRYWHSCGGWGMRGMLPLLGPL